MRFCYFQVIDLISEVNSRPNLKVWYQRLCLMTNITFVFFLSRGRAQLGVTNEGGGAYYPSPRAVEDGEIACA